MHATDSGGSATNTPAYFEDELKPPPQEQHAE